MQNVNKWKAELQKRIDDKSVHVAVVGLGYVGLPLAMEFARVGIRVTGYDRSERVVSGLMSGVSHIQDVPSAEVAVLPPEYRHEPKSALDGGIDGLDPARRLLAGAASRLTANGALIVEVGETAAALEATWPKVPWTWLEFERGGDGVFLLSADDLKHGWR